MIRRHALNVLIGLAAFTLLAGSPALAQTRKQLPRVRPTPAAMQAGSGKNLGFGVPETLAGKIQMVVPDKNLLVVSGPDDVPYDLTVTPKTLIVVGDRRATLDQLSGYVGKQVSVGFVPRRDGNYATRIEVIS